MLKSSDDPACIWKQRKFISFGIFAMQKYDQV